MTHDELTHWINTATYVELLRKWRFAPSEDAMFQDEIGVHFAFTLAHRRKEIGAVAAIAASNLVGFSPWPD